MQIKELSRRTNLSDRTLRYYEEIGLLPSPRRLPNGYRDYDEVDVERVNFVVGARKLDFSLDDIGEILSLREDGVAPCLYVNDLVGHRLLDIDAKISALQQLRGELEEIQKDAQALPHENIVDKDCICHLIENQAMKEQLI